MGDKDKEKEGKKEESKSKEEPLFEMLANPARVMKPQLRVVELAEEDVARYRPLKDVSIGGIVVVKNVSGEPCQIVEPVAVKKSGDKDDDDDGADGDEPEPPEPFTYVEEDETAENDDSSS